MEARELRHRRNMKGARYDLEGALHQHLNTSSETKVGQTTMTKYEELREVMRSERLIQIDRAAKAALAVPAAPRATYKLRVALAIAKAASDLTERELFQNWKDDPELKHASHAVHNALCDAKLGQTIGLINQLLADATSNNL